MSNKTRPIVVKFNYNSKLTVKVHWNLFYLYPTPYTVTDQYPPEVQQQRRKLIPVMVSEQKTEKKAVLVRDKLYINNSLYKPGSSTLNAS
jgi:hypothetical protein